MKVPCVSVIIPVYKVEEYLERCIESVLGQTLDDLEIILVDDGSPDNCPRICDQYAEKDRRVSVIHKKNGGLASARNAGMKNASGEYIFFLDSDDWLELDGLQYLYELGQKYQVDFVRYRAIRTGWPGMEENAPCIVEDIREMEGGIYNKNRILQEIYPRLLATSQLTFGPIVGVWGSLYKREFLKKNQLLFYEDIKFSEDLIFSSKVVLAAESFYYADQPAVYHYFYNKKSISKSFREGRWDSCKKTIELCENDFLKNEQFDFSMQIYYLKWFCLFLALNDRKFICDRYDKIKYCKKILEDDMVQTLKLNLNVFDISWKQKILMILVKFKCYKVIANV